MSEGARPQFPRRSRKAAEPKPPFDHHSRARVVPGRSLVIPAFSPVIPALYPRHSRESGNPDG